MVDAYVFILALLSALGSGLVAGVFFAFSSFVMQALGRVPAAWGITTMKAINVTVLNRSFLGIFMTTALLSVVGIVSAMLLWQREGAIFLFAGGALYLLGSFIVTIAFNVPRNEMLAGLPPEGAPSAELWKEYLAGWTRWNHVRTIASLLAMLCFALALAA